MTSETRFSSYILLIQNLFCFLLFHTHTEVYCLNPLPFSFSDINKPCTESCGLHMGNILHLRKLWWESFVPKQEANPSTLLRAQNGIALSSGSFKIMIRHQLTPRKHCAAGRWFPTASAWSLQYRSSSYSQLFGLERWGGYCHTLLSPELSIATEAEVPLTEIRTEDIKTVSPGWGLCFLMAEDVPRPLWWNRKRAHWQHCRTAPPLPTHGAFSCWSTSTISS